VEHPEQVADARICSPYRIRYREKHQHEACLWSSIADIPQAVDLVL